MLACVPSCNYLILQLLLQLGWYWAITLCSWSSVASCWSAVSNINYLLFSILVTQSIPGEKYSVHDPDEDSIELLNDDKTPRNKNNNNIKTTQSTANVGSLNNAGLPATRQSRLSDYILLVALILLNIHLSYHWKWRLTKNRWQPTVSALSKLVNIDMQYALLANLCHMTTKNWSYIFDRLHF